MAPIFFCRTRWRHGQEAVKKQAHVCVQEIHQESGGRRMNNLADDMSLERKAMQEIREKGKYYE